MSHTYKHKLTGSKAVDSSCRNHGNCPWCQGKRLYKIKRQEPIVEDEMSKCKNCGLDMGHSHLGDLCERCNIQHYLPEKEELTEYDYFRKELGERLHDFSKASQLAFE